MKLTLNSGIVNPAFGFGNATFHIFMTLKKLGYDVAFNDGSRDFQVAFTSPQNIHSFFTPRVKHKVGYFAWESSESVSGRIHHQMNFVDELWVPNECNARYARGWGFEGKIKIFPHGVDPRYSMDSLKKPLPKSRLDVVNIGYPGVRKQSKELFEAWADSDLANDPDASLTIKTYASVEDLAKETFSGVKNVHVVSKEFTVEENVNFLNNFNLSVYPSYGEGFGLIPLETMAMGLPTIVQEPGGWCDYADIQGEFNIPWTEGLAPSDLGRKYHPGTVFNVDMDDVIAKIREVGSDIPGALDYAARRASLAHERYNWFDLVEKHFEEYDLDMVPQPVPA